MAALMPGSDDGRSRLQGGIHDRSSRSPSPHSASPLVSRRHHVGPDQGPCSSSGDEIAGAAASSSSSGRPRSGRLIIPETFRHSSRATPREIETPLPNRRQSSCIFPLRSSDLSGEPAAEERVPLTGGTPGSDGALHTGRRKRNRSGPGGALASQPSLRFDASNEQATPPPTPPPPIDQTPMKFHEVGADQSNSQLRNSLNRPSRRPVYQRPRGRTASDGQDLDAEIMEEMDDLRQRLVAEEQFEFALLLKSNDEYAEAALMMELALDLTDGRNTFSESDLLAEEGGGGDGHFNHHVREGAKLLRASLGASAANMAMVIQQRGGEPADVRHDQTMHPPWGDRQRRRSSVLRTSMGDAVRSRLSLLCEMEEQEKLGKGLIYEDPNLSKQRREIEKKKQRRFEYFVKELSSKDGVTVRLHRRDREAQQVTLHSENHCMSISWQPLSSANDVTEKLQKINHILRLQGHSFQSVSGSLTAGTITNVLGATDGDPEHPGFFGSRNLRASRDFFNPARTFSVLYTAADGAAQSLDIECDDDSLYAILFQGFILLLMQSGPLPKSEPPPLPSTRRRQNRRTMESMGAPDLRSRRPSVRPVTLHQGSSLSDSRKSSECGDSIKDSAPNLNAFQRNISVKAAPKLPFFKSISVKRSFKRIVSLDRKMPVSEADVKSGLPQYFLGWTAPGTQVWSRLRMAGLEVERLYHLDTRKVMLRIRLPRSKMEQVAESMRLRMRRRDGTLARFKLHQRTRFAGSNYGNIFKSSESQKVIDHIIRSRIKDEGAELDERSALGKAIKARIPLHNMATLEPLYDIWVTFWRVNQGQDRESQSNMCSRLVYDFKDLLVTMNNVRTGCLAQPLELVAEYFGESIAFYFAWMGFYSSWLMLPSVVGVIYFCVQVWTRELDNVFGPLYSLFIVCWSSVFLISWRRRCSELAYQWGTLQAMEETEEQTRPQFHGSEETDQVTGKTRLVYPWWKRIFKFLFSVPCMLMIIVGVLVASLYLFRLRDRAVGDTFADGFSWKDIADADQALWIALLLIPTGLGVSIPILYQVCKRISKGLNGWENYRTDSQYRNALIVKLFSFRFVSVFAPMYYYAFWASGESNWKMLRLLCSLLSFMTVGQWWYMIWMTLLPYWWQQWQLSNLQQKVQSRRQELMQDFPGGVPSTSKEAYLKKLQNEAENPLWEEQALRDYEPDDDYTMSLIQFGYVTFFSMAFPLAPLLALINNLVQTRVDAFKLCRTRRRPIAQKTSGIGVWDNALELMTSIAVVTNCALVGFTSTAVWSQLPEMSQTTKVLVIIAFEHLLLFVKYWVESTVPRTPEKVTRAMQRERIIVAKRRETKSTGEHRPRGNTARAGVGGSSKVCAAVSSDPSSVSPPAPPPDKDDVDPPLQHQPAAVAAKPLCLPPAARLPLPPHLYAPAASPSNVSLAGGEGEKVRKRLQWNANVAARHAASAVQASAIPIEPRPVSSKTIIDEDFGTLDDESSLATETRGQESDLESATSSSSSEDDFRN